MASRSCPAEVRLAPRSADRLRMLNQLRVRCDAPASAVKPVAYVFVEMPRGAVASAHFDYDRVVSGHHEPDESKD